MSGPREQPEAPREEPLAVSGDAIASSGEPDELTRTVVRGVSLAGSGYLIAQALNLGFYLALARLAAPSDFGVLAAGSILLQPAMLLTESGMMSALIHRRDRIEEATQTAIAATALGGVAFGLLSLAIAPLLGLFFQDHTVTEVAAVLSGTIVLTSLSVVPAALLQRRFSFVRRVVVEPVMVICFGTAAVIATSQGMGVWGLVIGQYAAALAEFVVTWSLAPIRLRPKLVSFRLWRELAAYGRHVLAATVILRAGDQVDTGLIGRFLSTSALGQYRYAARLSGTSYAALVAAGSYVLFPAFARIAENRERFERGFMRSLRWLCFISFPVGMLLLPLGEPLAVLLFGETWHPAGEALAAMCVFPCASTLSSIASEALKADGKPQRLTRMHAVTTVSTALLMLALLPLGLNGVAAGLSAGAVIGGAYAIWQVKSHIGFRLDEMWQQIWPPAVASAIMALVVLGGERLADAGDHSFAGDAGLIAAGALLGSIVYLGILTLLAPTTISELRRGLAALPQRLRRRPEDPDPPSSSPLAEGEQ
jgi:O-antigen/teichoic acid export membrane protein